MIDLDGIQLHHGDCREVLASLPDCSVDSVVTDPPYELGFMGKAWDGSGIAYSVQMWAEVLRVLRPGGHLCAFGGTRTYHRMACAIEDAGFQIRDSLHWVYGSGFPKSLDVSKAIDKAAGAEREVVGKSQWSNSASHFVPGEDHTQRVQLDITTAATDAAKQWEGWGTALKPAHEPIVLARKPLIGTVAQNVLTHGTGALNIDGARVGTEVLPAQTRGVSKIGTFEGADGNVTPERTGRWPANVIFDTEAGSLLDEQADGASRFFTYIEWEPEVDVPFRYVPKPSKQERNAGLELCRCDKLSVTNKTEEQTWDSEDQQAAHPVDTDRSHQRDTGVSTTQHSDDSAWSTFLYGSSTTGQPPTDTKFTTSTTTNLTTESATLRSSTPQITSGSTQDARSATVNGGNLANSAENLNQSTKTIGTSARKVGRNTDDADPATSDRSSRISAAGRCDRCNKINTAHPTQKPLALMRWLVKLVTPPGGTVLEPFAGSGTTLMACVLEGFHGIGIEMTDEYLPIIEGRVRWAQHQPQRLNL